MTEKEPTQRTPQGAEIPIPKRSAFDRILNKIAKKPKGSTPRGPKK